jgi:hypothetical protein
MDAFQRGNSSNVMTRQIEGSTDSVKVSRRRISGVNFEGANDLLPIKSGGGEQSMALHVILLSVSRGADEAQGVTKIKSHVPISTEYIPVCLENIRNFPPSMNPTVTVIPEF